MTGITTAAVDTTRTGIQGIELIIIGAMAAISKTLSQVTDFHDGAGEMNEVEEKRMRVAVAIAVIKNSTPDDARRMMEEIMK